MDVSLFSDLNLRGNFGVSLCQLLVLRLVYPFIEIEECAVSLIVGSRQASATQGR